ncbi:hypothetical protein [Paenibacillus sp. FSL R5-0486]|uniref:hypothetical protein n=1 Tax=Paenibacillus sp. FSL R5-0486 TaxID=2921645 RepID=UPI0030DCDB6A
MKLHKDGTVEGTPQEIAEYNRLVNGTQTLGPVGGQYRSPSAASNPLLPGDTIKPVITSAGGSGIQSGGRNITAWNEMTRGIMQMQEEYWKNRKPEDRPTVMYGWSIPKYERTE